MNLFFFSWIVFLKFLISLRRGFFITSELNFGFLTIIFLFLLSSLSLFLHLLDGDFKNEKMFIAHDDQMRDEDKQKIKLE